LLFEITSGPSRELVRPSWVRRVFGRWLEPVLQPRFAMGMAMTVLSFAMLGRFSGIEVRQLKPSDLDPVQIWMTTEDRASRVWEHAVKYYDGLRLVYEIRAQLREWTDDPGEPGDARGQSGSGTGGPSPNSNAAPSSSSGVETK